MPGAAGTTKDAIGGLRQSREFVPIQAGDKRTTQEIFEELRRSIVYEGYLHGLALSVVNLYERRFGPMSERLRATMEKMHDETVLWRWIGMTGTSTAKEIASAIRAAKGKRTSYGVGVWPSDVLLGLPRRGGGRAGGAERPVL